MQRFLFCLLMFVGCGLGTVYVHWFDLVGMTLPEFGELVTIIDIEPAAPVCVCQCIVVLSMFVEHNFNLLICMQQSQVQLISCTF